MNGCGGAQNFKTKRRLRLRVILLLGVLQVAQLVSLSQYKCLTAELQSQLPTAVSLVSLNSKILFNGTVRPADGVQCYTCRPAYKQHLLPLLVMPGGRNCCMPWPLATAGGCCKKNHYVSV